MPPPRRGGAPEVATIPCPPPILRYVPAMLEPIAQATQAEQLATVCGSDPGIACEFVFELTENEFLARAVEWAVSKPLKVVFIFLVAFVANRLLRRAIQRSVDRLVVLRQASAQQREEQEVGDGRFESLLGRAEEKLEFLKAQSERSQQRARTLGTVLKSIATSLIYGFAVLMVLGEFGVNLGPLIAGAGVVGIALGFGAQTIVRDFLSGIFMMLEDQYGVGDVIDFGETAGVVEEISLRTTQLRDVHGTVWFVPNGEIKRVGNKSQLWSRTVLDIDVAYDTDLGRAGEIIKGVAIELYEEQPEKATIIEPPEIWGVERFGDNSITIRLAVKTEPLEQWAVGRELRGRLKRALDEAGIEIPFPQRTVWIQQAGSGEREPTSVLHAVPPQDKLGG